MKNRLAYLQHVDAETPGSILDWATSKKMSVTASHLYRNDPLPNIENFDHLVIMGGPMDVKDESQFPWMRDEKMLIEEAMKAGKRVVGICLGAQILAGVLGARVYKNPHKEIGWLPIRWTPAAKASPFFQHMPQEHIVFHWHGDTFDLPSGALHLASSVACPHQAYSFGDNVLGLQFHMEVKPENVKRMVHVFADELIERPYIQSSKKILDSTSMCQQMNDDLFAMLDAFMLGE